MESSERQLLERIYRGDRQAEGELVRQFDYVIRRKIESCVQADKDRIHDILAEVHLAIIQSIRQKKFSMENGRSLGAYIYGITRNKISDFYKERKRHQNTEIFPQYLMDTIKDLELERKELAFVLRKELEKLQPKYKKILYLRYFKELSITEICEQLDLSPRRVSERIHYAVKLLRKNSKKKLSIFLSLVIIIHKQES
ncbi:sigma-70 family RNA polymerase sigma factor [candidate division KSB1 bacterium]|nr:sigma-70 family RNA polymerase sigma factor [candidate division KSB1 bacterium]